MLLDFTVFVYVRVCESVRLCACVFARLWYNRLIGYWCACLVVCLLACLCVLCLFFLLRLSSRVRSFV